MKITAGIGSLDAYIPCALAGAAEVFCGYVPHWWTERFGIHAPLNRRESLLVNVQLGSFSELLILKRMEDKMKVPVTLTFNSPFYPPLQYAPAAQVIEECLQAGFSRFILADPGLLLYLNACGLSEKMEIHLSGEIGEISSSLIRRLQIPGVKRIIFHRKVSIRDMASMIRSCPGLEYEAFLLNELCLFHGGYCSTLHCDEMSPFCHLPFRLDPPDPSPLSLPVFPGRLTGETGCGLCALYALKEAGITHLKVVGRGNDPDDTLADLADLKKALSLAEKAESASEYRLRMRKALFPEGCSLNCYYREESDPSAPDPAT